FMSLEFVNLIDHDHNTQVLRHSPYDSLKDVPKRREGLVLCNVGAEKIGVLKLKLRKSQGQHSIVKVQDDLAEDCGLAQYRNLVRAQENRANDAGTGSTQFLQEDSLDLKQQAGLAAARSANDRIGVSTSRSLQNFIADFQPAREHTRV